MGSDYTCTEQISVGRKSVVYRGLRGQRDRIVVKRLRDVQLDRSTIAAYQREFEISRRLAGVAGVVRIHELTEEQGAVDLVMEDGGTSLPERMRIRRFTLDEILEIGARVANILGEVHGAGIVHQDINPSNIVVHLGGLDVKLIDFGLSFVIGDVGVVGRAGNRLQGSLEGTLVYLAPEQTGRGTRAVDHRADLYALGATLYELATGAPPFVFEDPAELIHAHLARRPVEPHLVDPAIPETVSRILVKLLAKDPDDRYQSALGVAADLEVCLVAWRATGEVPLFEIGRRDVRQLLALPNVLYGRDEPLAMLRAGLVAASGGRKQLQLVGGYAGVGKSALIQELRVPTLDGGGYYAAGKFDQLRNEIPYTGITAALREVLATILSQPAEQVARWREALRSALGDDVALLIDLVPELGLLLDVPAAVVDSSLDRANRVPHLLVTLVAALARPDRPLVLVLDDLHWADRASLNLVESLMRSFDVRALYLVGSYRDNEVTAAHPLMLMVQALELEGLAVAKLVLEPLQLPSVVRLLGEALGLDAGAVLPLAQLVVDKTRGNPFFVRAFIETLADTGLLRFAAKARCWEWDLAAVRSSLVTDSVVDLLMEKLDRQPSEVRVLLRAAACLGNEFDRETLAIAAESPADQLEQPIGLAVEAGLILRNEGVVAAGTFRFAHDRIQQAAYELIDPGERVAVHQALGRRLLAALAPDQRDARLFELLHHLNMTRDRAASGEASARPDEVPELLALNLAAAHKARARGAPVAALHHGELALAILIERSGSADGAWQADHALALEIHDVVCEAAFLAGDPARMEEVATAVRVHARDVLETVRSIRVRIAAMHLQRRLEEVLDLFVATLAALGVRLPRHPTRFRVLRALASTLWRIRDMSAADIIALPRMTDPRWLAVTDLANDVALVAYLASQKLFAILHLKVVDLSVEHGNSDGSPTSYVSLAILLGGVLGRVERGDELGDAAEALMPTVAQSYRGVPGYALHAVVRHWRHPLRECLPGLLAASRDGIASGKFKPAATALYLYLQVGYFSGRGLVELASESAEYAVAIRQINDVTAYEYHQRVRQSVLNLIGDSETPWLLEGECFDERTDLPVATAPDHKTHRVVVYIEKLLLASLFRQTEAGLSYLAETDPLLDSIPGLVHIPVHALHGALVELAACDGASAGARRRLLRSARRRLRKLERYARGAPMNYLHFARLVEAEVQRVVGRQDVALAAYEEAIELAKEHGFRQHEAQAHELAGRFHLGHGRSTAGHAHLARARGLYLRWGALAKVRHLDRELRELAIHGEPSTSTGEAHAGTLRLGGATATVSSTDLDRALDLGAVMKASQRLSSEVVLARLVTQLMSLVAENAGAERGFLIVQRHEQWMIEAAYGDASTATLPVMLEGGGIGLATSIVHYVARMRAPVVLVDAAGQGAFVGDAYVRARRPRSILAVPMLRQGELTGVLYLENNQRSGAFTPDRVEVLGFLAAQAAISIENARLYESLEAKVTERTQKLEQLQQVALANAHHAGMAEIATGVLHNVGNVVNSVVVSCGQLERAARESRFRSLAKVAALFDAEGENLPRFFAEDPKAKPLLEYLGGLARALEVENDETRRELANLRKQVELIVGVVAAQQTYATGNFLIEPVDLARVVEDALDIQRQGLTTAGIRVERRFHTVVPVRVHKTKLTHALINLIKNAEDALAQTPSDQRMIAIEIGVAANGQSYVRISDNGCGITAEDLHRVFNHGFTTKPHGHGFGLHSCANSMVEMRGRLAVESAGPGQGATFTLWFGTDT